MRIVPHPIGAGWLAVTEDIEYLMTVTHKLLLPDGQTVHPLHFHPALDDVGAWAAIRAERSRLLLSSDWTQISDSPLADNKKSDWKTYRKALRDIPQTYTSPDDVVWPTTPPEE